MDFQNQTVEIQNRVGSNSYLFLSYIHKSQLDNYHIGKYGLQFVS